MSKKSVVIILVAVAFLILAILAICQFLLLQKAHSTFQNYYAFRGCVQLIQKTDTYGFCRIQSGQVIKIVEINNKWYLDGDGPGMW